MAKRAMDWWVRVFPTSTPKQVEKAIHRLGVECGDDPDVAVVLDDLQQWVDRYERDHARELEEGRVRAQQRRERSKPIVKEPQDVMDRRLLAERQLFLATMSQVDVLGRTTLGITVEEVLDGLVKAQDQVAPLQYPYFGPEGVKAAWQRLLPRLCNAGWVEKLERFDGYSWVILTELGNQAVVDWEAAGCPVELPSGYGVPALSPAERRKHDVYRHLRTEEAPRKHLERVFACGELNDWLTKVGGFGSPDPAWCLEIGSILEQGLNADPPEIEEHEVVVGGPVYSLTEAGRQWLLAHPKER